MFRWRYILWTLVLLPRLTANGAAPGDALANYNARLQEISRSYNQQFSEIRKKHRQAGSGKPDIRSGEREIRQLALARLKAVAEAREIFQKEQKQAPAETSPGLSREQQERAQWEAQQKAEAEGQKTFWANARRREAGDAERWGEQLRAAEEGQNGFWTDATLIEAEAMTLWNARVQEMEAGQGAFWAEHSPTKSGSLENTINLARRNRQDRPVFPRMRQKSSEASLPLARQLAVAY